MSLRLVSPNKRLTRVPGRGVQFLPGYPEPFSDTVALLLRGLRRPLSVIEVGGGGLSLVFRLAALPNVERVVCCDPDVSALDYHAIGEHFGLPERLVSAVRRKCTVVGCGGEDLLALIRPDLRVDVVCAMRVLHFFTPARFEAFLAAARIRLRPDGRLILSGFGRMDHDDPARPTEFWAHSRPIGRRSYHRRLDVRSATARRLIAEQNLQRDLLFFEEPYLRDVAARTGFRVVRGPERATRVIDGWVLAPARRRRADA
jgi:SAM-dependent methyltransferase